ncbi:MAG: hypothetical protein SH868_19130 [Bythopirellula sp.]|nr:hypothetical protein [Bythopirellula sp.]
MAESNRKFGFGIFPSLLLALGVVLVLASFLPLSALSKRQWTIADSEAFSQVTRELHDSTTQLPRQSGRTADELAGYQENLKQEFEKLKSKLEHAQQEPQRWSRILLWTGTALVGVGGLIHIAKQSA